MRNIDAEAFALLHDLWLELKELQDYYENDELTTLEKRWYKKLKTFFENIANDQH